MSTREERTIELNVISATGLKKVKTFGRQTSYAVAFIYPNSKKATKVDNDGGLNPSWNSTLNLTVDKQLLEQGRGSITIEIYSSGSFGDKLVGTAFVPLSEIAIEHKSKEGKEGKEGSSVSGPQYMAVEVHRPSGKTKGVLNLSVALGGKRTVKVYENQPPPQTYNGQPPSRDRVTAYPAGPLYPPHAYHPQQVPYYPQQGYPQQGYYYPQPPRRGGGGLGGAGLGLGAGLLGGLLVGDAVGHLDAYDDMADYGGDLGGVDF